MAQTMGREMAHTMFGQVKDTLYTTMNEFNTKVNTNSQEINTNSQEITALKRQVAILTTARAAQIAQAAGGAPSVVGQLKPRIIELLFECFEHVTTMSMNGESVVVRLDITVFKALINHVCGMPQKDAYNQIALFSKYGATIMENASHEDLSRFISTENGYKSKKSNKSRVMIFPADTIYAVLRQYFSTKSDRAFQEQCKFNHYIREKPSRSMNALIRTLLAKGEGILARTSVEDAHIFVAKCREQFPGRSIESNSIQGVVQSGSSRR